MEKVSELKDKSDRQVRDDFQLQNPKGVDVFKGVLGRLIGNQ